LAAGFRASPSLDDGDYCTLKENALICRKMPEIEDCSADGYCRMNFSDDQGNKISVVTFGDGPGDPSEVVNGFEVECKR
jgi:hypothetical protein